MHDPVLIPGKGGGAAAQNMPIRANAPTVILPPAKSKPRTFVGKGVTARTGLAIPENHALTIVCDGPVLLTLVNKGDDDIVLPFPAGYFRVIPIKEIGFVDAIAIGGNAPTHFTLWIEDLRAMEPWICEGEYRP